MRTTIDIDDGLLARATALTGIREPESLVRRGLEALVASAAGSGLARSGGSEPDLRPIPRRRPPRS